MRQGDRARACDDGDDLRDSGRWRSGKVEASDARVSNECGKAIETRFERYEGTNDEEVSIESVEASEAREVIDMLWPPRQPRPST